MNHIYCTAPVWSDAKRLYASLSEVPHMNSSLVLLDWGAWPKTVLDDQIVVVISEDQMMRLDDIGDTSWANHPALIHLIMPAADPQRWLALLHQLGMGGTRCQLDKGLAAWNAREE